MYLDFLDKGFEESNMDFIFSVNSILLKFISGAIVNFFSSMMRRRVKNNQTLVEQKNEQDTRKYYGSLIGRSMQEISITVLGLRKDRADA